MKRRGVASAMTSQTVEIIARVARWLVGNVENRRRGLLLYGDIGLGKTTLCTAIVGLVQHCKSVVAEYSHANRWRLTKEQKQDEWVWLRTPSPSYTTAAEISQTSDSERARLAQASVLIIDDIGVEPVEVNTYGTKITPIVDIINERYANQRCTIITTNLDEDGIRARYGDRIEDRLKEMCDKVSFSGESYRR